MLGVFLKVESGKLKVESGKLKVESGKLKVESGNAQQYIIKPILHSMRIKFLLCNTNGQCNS